MAGNYEQQLRTLRIINGCMFAYSLFLIYFTETRLRKENENLSETASYAFVVFAISMTSAFGMFYRRATAANAASMVNDDDDALRKKWAAFSVALFALAEGIVLYGFLGRFMGGGSGWFVLYAWGLCLLLVACPRRSSAIPRS